MTIRRIESARVHYGPRSEDLDLAHFPWEIESDHPEAYLEAIRVATVKAHNWWGQKFQWRERPVIDTIPGSIPGTVFYATGFTVIYS